ncbi:MAG: hypothetical protein JNK52_08825, partial [Zoogloeaceae bacterium]|nr:hypothetical protein [Zoogloeaceae bacterium]
FEVLRAIRKRHPEWPVLIAQTGLHELYPPGMQHPDPYPFDDGLVGPDISADLARALIDQRDRLGSLSGAAPVRWVPIDLTLPDDGFEPAYYGLDALWAQMEAVSSLDLRRQLIGDEAVRDVFERTAHQHIVGYTLTAAGLGAVPVIDLVAVSAVQAKLLHALAVLYGQSWDRRMVTEFVGLLGASVATGFVSRMIGKTVAKLIPGWGQTIGLVWGASASGATTYALGKAAVYFFARRRAGLTIDAEALRGVYSDALAAGRDLIARRARGKDE